MFKNCLILDESSPSGLRWKIDVYTGKNNKCLKIKAGSVAGCLSKSGYYLVRVNKILYRAHRVIFEMAYGEISKGLVIDHIDGNPSNNVLSNLRSITQAENSRNSRKKSSNKSTVTGVYRQTTVSGYDYMVAQAEVLGEVKTKAFSIIELGLAEATRQAVEYRINLVNNFNQKGALFSERHGK